jgi:hypothetical protein
MLTRCSWAELPPQAVSFHIAIYTTPVVDDTWAIVWTRDT